MKSVFARISARFASGFLIVIDRRHPAGASAIAAMNPQELLRITPYHIFDGLLEARRVLQRISIGATGALNRNFILNLDSMMTAIWCAYDERGNHRSA